MKLLECPSEGSQPVGLASSQQWREGGRVGLEIGELRRTVPASGRQAKLSDPMPHTCHEPVSAVRSGQGIVANTDFAARGLRGSIRRTASRGPWCLVFRIQCRLTVREGEWFEAGVGRAGPVKLQCRLSISPRPASAEVPCFVPWTDAAGHFTPPRPFREWRVVSTPLPPI